MLHIFIFVLFLGKKYTKGKNILKLLFYTVQK